MHYTPRGVCSRDIELEIEDGIVQKVVFTSGCPGNLLGISSLVQGMEATEVIKRLKGTKCGNKPTSCPDQLALAIESYLSGGANA